MSSVPPEGGFDNICQDQAVFQFAHLASQHENSDYNRTKFTQQIRPYVPLSIQIPHYFEQLCLQQAQGNSKRAWWRRIATTSESPIIPVGPTGPIVLGPCGTSFIPSQEQSEHLTHELSLAIHEPLAMQNVMAHSVKTSTSHPINISSIIPQELIPTIASHGMLASSHNVHTIFQLPFSKSLDWLIASRLQRGNASFIPTQEAFMPPFSFHDPYREPTHDHSIVADTFRNVLNPDITISLRKRRAPSIPRSLSPPPSPQQKNQLSTFHSNTSSVSLSLSLTITTNPPNSLTTSRSESDLNQTPRGPSPSTQSTVLPALPEPFVMRAPDTPSKLQNSVLLGNLFLSSCPGKKVRLQGPVKGRSGVCRDLLTDLRRMRDLGVGCIVCCLDDSELEFLGSPWPEYERATREVGLDVLRLPTPEGLSPTASPSLLDEHLSTLIADYTLQGIPVLVHCRGGVGRAGVIAVCWILKLGLCSMEPSSHSEPPFGGAYASGFARPDTLRLVERVINLVRRRRSLKAIETYEQVRFLVDYAEYLRSKGRGALSSE